MISHEQIFQLVTGIYPECDKSYFSPFRKNDTNPGVRFAYRKGYLRMYDHRAGIVGWNAFDLVSYKLTGQRIPSVGTERKRVFAQVLDFIKGKLGGVNQAPPSPSPKVRVRPASGDWASEPGNAGLLRRTRDHEVDVN